MLYKAFVKDKETGKINFMEYDYGSKSDFIRDLKLNGYTVIRVEPKELYDFVLDNTDADKYDWEAAKKLYKEHKPLTKEELDKMKHGVYNSSRQIKSANVEMKDFDEIIRVNISPESTKIPKLYRQAVMNRDRNAWEQMKDMIYNEPYIDVEAFNTWWVPRLNKMERKLFSSRQIKSAMNKNSDSAKLFEKISKKVPGAKIKGNNEEGHYIEIPNDGSVSESYLNRLSEDLLFDGYKVKGNKILIYFDEGDYGTYSVSPKQIKSSDLKVDPVSPVHPIPEKLPKKEEKLKAAKKKLTDKNGKTFEDYLNEEAIKSGYDRNHEAIDKLFNTRRPLNEGYQRNRYNDMDVNLDNIVFVPEDYAHQEEDSEFYTGYDEYGNYYKYPKYNIPFDEVPGGYPLEDPEDYNEEDRHYRDMGEMYGYHDSFTE